MRLVCDFETYSPVDLLKCGAYRYAEHPGTGIYCLALKVDDKSPVLWAPRNFVEDAHYHIDNATHGGQDFLDNFDLVSDSTVNEMVAEAEIIEAHNMSGFEVPLWHHIMHKRWGFINLPKDKLRCSAAQAAMHALPRSLDGAGNALGLDITKDKKGHALMLKMCKPRAPRKAEWVELDEKYGTEMHYNIAKRAYFDAKSDKIKAYAGYIADNWDKFEDPEGLLLYHREPVDLMRLFEYCLQDVDAEYAVSEALFPLPPAEQKLWQLDMEINERGVMLDTKSVEKCLDIVDQHVEVQTKELQAITGGAVQTAKQTTVIGKWLKDQGVELPNLQKQTVIDALAGDLPVHARRFLEIRQSLGMASTAKYDAMKRMACSDGRIKGMFMYHGASTGRWAGKGVQLQNLPRGSFKDVDACIDVMHEWGYHGLMDWYGDPMTAVSTCIRGMLVAEEGKRFLCADFSSIEARVLAWLADEDKVLLAFRNNLDLYKVAAMDIYHEPYEAIDGSQRQVGKCCIAEGELVLTDVGLVPIEEVTTRHRVWDGVAWVKHDGPIYQGEKEVITYEGLTATPDHEVFTESGKKIPFGEAASTKDRIARTGNGGEALRYCGDSIDRDKEGEKLDTAHKGEVSKLRGSEVDKQAQPVQREDPRLPKMQPSEGIPEMVVQKNVRREEPLPKQKAQAVQKLRGERHRISVPLSARGVPMGVEQSRVGERETVGQDKQRGPLRAGKSQVGKQSGEQQQQKVNNGCTGNAQVQTDPPRSKVRGRHLAQPPVQRSELRGNCGEVEHPKPQAKRRVWDLLNCGPHNRFTVSGKLVHNCVLALGYQGGVGAFQSMAKVYGIKVPDDEAQAIVDAWRGGHQKTTAFWRKLNYACIQAIKTGETMRVGLLKIKVVTAPGGCPFLVINLPSKRSLFYCKPSVTSDDYGDKMRFWGVNGYTRKWEEQSTYGGKLTENVVQAVARDLLRECMFDLEDEGYKIVAHVHDEALTEMADKSLEDMCEIMSRVPHWATGLPMAADGWEGRRFRK